ncbi:MAG TPA: NAD(P)/FAD-dependent oxidoreductase [Polyangiaceae bacterium]|nr:NAD(P)/FAD-dependent oxidoreductase [Polyangiaceae bacterium]
MARLEALDAVIAGGGVIGLAVARALARAGRSVVLLEAETALGTHASSRNSEVVHAGIDYAPGSLKAELCVAGKHALYAYCEEQGVPYALPGKLVVATRDAEIAELERLAARAEANGVHDLVWLDGAGVRALEPELTAVRALWSPSTGIVSSHALMAALKREAVERGAVVVLSTPVLGGRVEQGGFVLELGGSEPTTVRCRTFVNAAGLAATALSRALAGVPATSIPRQYFAKGRYFALTGASPFRHLVYPVPEPGGLGVHVTLDLAGAVRFGPDVTWVDGVDYAVEETRAAAFYAAVRRYYPALADGALVPSYAGVRTKLVPSGAPPGDFVVSDERAHGVPGLVALYGIESPGLTACLAIAERACASLTGRGLPG